MYAGHVSVALGAHGLRRRTPLWLLLLAAQLPDWYDAGFCSLALDRGRDGLYTHGLHVIALSAIVLAGGYALATRDRFGGVIVALTLASHYALDFLTGVKPTWPGGPSIGLALYARPTTELFLELATILLGWWLYRRTLPGEQRNRWTVYAMLAALLAWQAIAGVAFYLNLGGNTKC